MHAAGHDEHWMVRTLNLAEASAGLASPNPQVGCVLVRDGAVLGEGAHRYDLFDHAEIVALKAARAAGHDPRGATAYITLEPCSHHGRTGPCADALLAAGLARVVVATADPNPQVAGRGLERLRTGGVIVDLLPPGPLRERARRMNDAFAFSITHGRPFVTLKSALSADGFLAPPPSARTAAEPFWLTGPESRAEVQRMRHASDAILTGIGTVLADDPLLTDRTGLPRRKPLLRIVLDPALRIPLTSKLVASATDDLHVFCHETARREQAEKFDMLAAHAMLEFYPGTLRAAPLAVLERMQQMGLSQPGTVVRSLLLEAGPALNAAFLHAGLVDRVTLFYAQTELGPDALPFAAGGPTPCALEERMTAVTKRAFGDDVCISGLLRDPWAALPETTQIG